MKESKYKIGDKVWMIYQDKPTERQVTGVFALVSPNYKNTFEFKYYFSIELREYEWVRELLLFPDKQSLIESL